MDQLDFSVEEAKIQGKNRLVVYDDGIAKKNMRKLKIVAILQDAIKNDLFEVYYQPIYNIRENCFDRAEALLRLNNTIIGNIPPSEFIPIAEEHGLIVEIGYIVIDKVAQMMAEIRRLNPEFKAININVSVLQLLQKNFAQRFFEILKFFQVDPGMIELEITETGMIRSFDEMRDIMKNLKSFGIAFSLDDFGTGYSNLRYLIDLPFNCIKLDRHFINEINTDMRSRAFLKSLISLTKTLNYGVVAEGVEEPEQYRILSESNCDYIQGFYMARPMPGNEFNRFLYLR
jgi:EAL domain-containing protein (putative c-di-GMP-specific phosphodiesterase class I)